MRLPIRFSFQARAACLSLLLLIPGCAPSTSSTAAAALRGRSGAPPADAQIDAESLPRLVLADAKSLITLDDAALNAARTGKLIDVDEEGQVYVFDADSLKIRVYSSQGELVRSIGGGYGFQPGRFLDRSIQFGISGDTVWAIDPNRASRRITYFDRAGTVLSTTMFPEVRIEYHSPAQYRWLAPAVRDSSGLFVGDFAPTFGITISPELQAVRPQDSIAIPRVRYDATGKVVDTLGFHPSRFRSSATEIISFGSSRYEVPAPPRDDPLEIREPDGRISVTREAPGTESRAVFRVTRMSVRGDTLNDFTLGYRPQRYKPNVLDSLAFRAARAPGGSYGVLGPDGYESIRRFAVDSAAARPVIRAAMRFPDFQPPIQGFWRANDGGLWLRREDTPSETVRWIVFDPELRPIGELALPRSFRPVWGKGDQLWAIETDASNATRLVRFRIQRPSVS